MNKPLPWNVKGVGFDAREAARLAAKRAGVPLGEWLNGVIAARAAELGVQVDDIEAEDRLEAIAARVSASEHASATLQGGRSGNWADLGEPAGLTKRDAVLPTVTAGVGSSASATMQATPSPAISAPAPVSGVAQSVSAPSRFARTAMGHGAMPAPAPIDPMGRMQERWRPGTASSAVAVAPAVQPDPEQLDERLNAVLTKLNRSFEAATEISQSFGDSKATRNRPGAETEAKTATGDAVGHRSANPFFEPRPATASDKGASVPHKHQRPETVPGTTEYADLHAAFKTLAEKLEAQLNGTQDSKASERQGADRMRRASRPSVRNDLQLPERDAEIEDMQRELAQLATDVAELSPQRSLASLETTVRELGGRIDLLRLDGVQSSLLAPIDRLGQDMRDAIRSTDATAAVEHVRRDVKALAAKLDAQPNRPSDSRAIDDLKGELGDLRRTIGTLTERISASDRLGEEISSLGERVGVIADRMSPALSRDLAQAIGDIRRLLGAFDPHAGFGALDQKIDHLSARLDAMADTRGPELNVTDMMRQINRAHDTLVDRLEARGPASDNLSGIEASLGSLSAKLDTIGRASQDVNALYGLVGNLADRMQDARDPQADVQAFAALQVQIGQLVKRLDRSEADSATLHGVERLIGDLFLQIEQTRNTAIDAAENAARAAAQDTLRAAMDNPALNGAELTMQTGLDVDHVSQELAELRRVQETADRRITGTLTALNGTLERLLDHMVATLPSPPLPTVEAAAAEKALRRRRRSLTETASRDAEVTSDLPPFDPEQFLLEPGSLGSVGQVEARASHAVAPVPQVGGDGSDSVAPLIAAARRAAKAAQVSALETASPSRGRDADRSAVSRPGKVRSFFATRRRPLLLALAGVVLLLGTLQIVRLSTEGSMGDAGAVAPAAPPPASSPAPDKGASLSDVPAAKVASAASIPTSPMVADPTPTGSVPAAVPATDLAALTGLTAGLKGLAMGGNAPAQFEVAVRLSDGKGLSRDAKAAATWFERAARQGLAPAQYRLGSLYEKGIGVQPDPQLAIAWYEKAAAQGNTRAMHNLAVMSAEGAGAKADYGKAVTWFTKAASYGVRDSQYNLAVLFARGLGVPQNLGQSYAWFALAAQQGDADAVTKRDAVAGKLDPKALADAKSTVATFHPLSSDAAANDVAPPPGGWEAAAPGKTAAARKVEARVSSM